MIRGAVVVTPQAPAQRTWPSPAPAQPWAGPGATPGDTRPASHWVMPADNQGAKWTGRLHLVLFGLFVVAFLVVGIVGAVSNASPEAPGENTAVATGAPAAPAVSNLQVGDCFDLESPYADVVGDVTVRRCDEEHQFELFLATTVEGLSYPVESEWQTFYDEYCPPAFVDYVGSPFGGSVLDIYWLIPTRDGWHQGDHTLQCAVFHPDIPRLTAPLKDVGRVGTGTDT
jgi:hypothetical protein